MNTKLTPLPPCFPRPCLCHPQVTSNTQACPSHWHLLLPRVHSPPRRTCFVKNNQGSSKASPPKLHLVNDITPLPLLPLLCSHNCWCPCSRVCFPLANNAASGVAYTAMQIGLYTKRRTGTHLHFLIFSAVATCVFARDFIDDTIEHGL